MVALSGKVSLTGCTSIITEDEWTHRFATGIQHSEHFKDFQVLVEYTTITTWVRAF